MNSCELFASASCSSSAVNVRALFFGDNLRLARLLCFLKGLCFKKGFRRWLMMRGPEELDDAVQRMRNALNRLIHTQKSLYSCGYVRSSSHLEFICADEQQQTAEQRHYIGLEGARTDVKSILRLVETVSGLNSCLLCQLRARLPPSEITARGQLTAAEPLSAQTHTA